MTNFNSIKASLKVGAQLDNTGRLRVSQLKTLAEYKQFNAEGSVYWDEVVSGTATSVYTQSEGGMVMSVNANSDYVIRETYQRHNYGAGKPQLIEVTFSDFQSVANTTKRVGYFSSSTSAPYTANIDGLFLENDGTDVRFRVVKDGTDRLNVAQSSWNYDTFNGSGASGKTIDWSKFNVAVIDFLYLGGTGARLWFVIGDELYLAHEFEHANGS